MNDRARHAVASSITLGRAITTYLADLPPEERDASAPELHRMMRWFGDERNLDSLGPAELERYQAHLSDSGIDTTLRLGPVKDFLSYAKQKRLTTTNLSVHVRVRRKATPRKPANGQGQTGGIARVEMTREGYEQLRRELERLENEVAPQIRADLQSAYADKDFRENAPYEAAKQRLGEVQGKINELKATLSAAMIVEVRPRTDKVALGSTVVVRDLDDDEELTYTLVGPGEVDPRRGRISVHSPVGKALVNRTAGETIQVTTPAGTTSLRIERLLPAAGS